MENAPELQQQPQKKRHWLLWIFPGLFILLILCVVVLTRLVFAPWQEIAPVFPTAKDFSLQYKVMRKISKDLSRDRKKKKKIAEVKALRLKPEEINSLFRIAANVQSSRMPLPLRYYRPYFDEAGQFHVTVPYRTPLKWLWGGTVYVKIVFTVTKSSGEEVDFRIVSLYANKLPLCREWAQRAADEFMFQEKVRLHLEKFNTLVDKLHYSGGKLHIEYRPDKLLASGMY